jgi:membrane protease YdiL (CAAX protease family)
MLRVFLAPDGRLRAGWRFLLGAFSFVVAEFGTERIAAFIAGPDGLVVFVFLQEPLSLAAMLLLFSFLLTVADRVPHDRLAAQGLPTSGPWFQQTLDGVALGGGMVTVCVIVIAGFGQVSFNVALTTRTTVAAALAVGLLAVSAMKEEVAFRGYPFQRLVEAGGRRGGPVLGIVVLSVLFGLVHWWNPSRTTFSTANTVLIGIVLAVAYLRTRALWLPFGIHFGWNFTLGVMFGLPVSGIEDFSVLVKGHAFGPVWLTGGPYGIEGSALATVVVLLGALPVLLYPSGRESDETGLGRKSAARAATDSSGGIQP